MKLDMELKPGDVVLLKFLACVLIACFMLRFLVFPGIEHHQELVMEREQAAEMKAQMETVISEAPSVEQTIKGQLETLGEKKADYDGLLENQAVDELVTGVILKHDLFPVYLSIEEAKAGVPEAYFLSEQAKNRTEEPSDSSSDAAAEQDAEAAEDSLTDTDAFVQYTNTTEVSVTIQGSEENLRAFLNDIAVSYPGIQVRSFHMQKGTYLNQELEAIESMNLNCVLAVYTCGDLSDPTFGEGA